MSKIMRRLTQPKVREKALLPGGAILLVGIFLGWFINDNLCLIAIGGLPLIIWGATGSRGEDEK